ncbi:recombinase family protein [Geotoga petraea]|uniref:Site-specific DNA recombinase n=1 Tax=Geotoga petraea TaxID=28234 RepID=A0A1G6LNL4_9BACT|nr:recombinase family protein [Geotoga petraea]SDC44888.1 Site-specific DNA recombinase [Geotoga petraea]
MKYAAAYARVSTKEQSILSIEGQFEKIETYARNNKIQVVKKYYDKESGTSESRENFDKLLEDAYSKKFSIILVEKIDRFSRFSKTRAEMIIEELEKEGIFVIAVDQPFDVGSPYGRFMRSILLSQSKLEAEVTQERTTQRMRDIAKHGYWMGGKPPYGYYIDSTKDSEGRKRSVLKIKRDEAKVVREIFKLFNQGWGYKKITEYLNNHLEFAKPRSKKGLWNTSTVHDMLKNEKYVGTYVYGKGYKKRNHVEREDAIKIPGVVPAIIKKEEWELAKSKVALGGQRTRTVKTYILRGYLMCGECGAKMSGTSGKYICSAYANKQHDVYVSVSQNKIEKIVIDYILKQIERFTDQDYQEMAELYKYLRKIKDKSKNEDINKLKEALSKIQNKIKNIVGIISQGELNRSLLQELDEESKRLEVERDNIVSELNYINSKAGITITAEQIKEKYEDMKVKLNSENWLHRQDVISDVIDKVIYYKSGLYEIKMK